MEGNVRTWTKCVSDLTLSLRDKQGILTDFLSCVSKLITCQ